MAGFLYYLPGCEKPVSTPHLADLGLAHAFPDGHTPSSRQVQQRTPDGRRGMLVADEQRMGGRLPSMDMKGQVWRESPTGNYWVGYWADAKPTPDDLARKEQVPGFLVTMADGKQWHVPVVRLLDEETGLAKPAVPHVLQLDGAGQIVPGPVVDRWRYIWDATEEPWQQMLLGGNVSDQAMIGTAGILLGVNYAIDGYEAFTLGIYSSQIGPASLVSLSIDYFTFDKWQQKKTNPESTGDGSSTSLGGEED